MSLFNIIFWTIAFDVIPQYFYCGESYLKAHLLPNVDVPDHDLGDVNFLIQPATSFLRCHFRFLLQPIVSWKKKKPISFRVLTLNILEKIPVSFWIFHWLLRCLCLYLSVWVPTFCCHFRHSSIGFRIYPVVVFSVEFVHPFFSALFRKWTMHQNYRLELHCVNQRNLSLL